MTREYILLRSETVLLRVCGNCEFAKGSSDPEDIKQLEEAYPSMLEMKTPALALLRREVDRLKEAKVLCRKEKTEMGVFDKACVFWKKNRILHYV